LFGCDQPGPRAGVGAVVQSIFEFGVVRD